MERAEAEVILDGDRETAVALLLRVGELIEANERLEARVAELERRLQRSSRNSSLPPSQDPPSAPPRPRRPGSGRTRGGQPGHEGRYRGLLPPERVEEVVEHWPRLCRTCAHVFDGQELVDAAEPGRHQVAELPPIAVRVTEHRLHAVRCPACTSRTRAELRREVPRSAFGPRLQAAVVTLAVRNRVSRRDTTELARELFGVELATGVGFEKSVIVAPASRGCSVFVAEPAENFASVDAQRGRTESGGQARLRRLERERAMWPVPVEVVDVVPEYAVEVASVEDQDAVEAVATERPDPTLGVSVRVRRPNRRADDPACPRCETPHRSRSRTCCRGHGAGTGTAVPRRRAASSGCGPAARPSARPGWWCWRRTRPGGARATRRTAHRSVST